jgi:hypothetical protein
LLGALAVAGGLAASAEAAVTLPSNNVQMTSDAVFQTSFQPTIDVKTGLLVDRGSLPELNAWGEVVNLADANDSDNKGTISGELTWQFHGELQADPSSLTPTFNSDNTQVHYTIVSTIKNAAITFYDDDSADFNVLSQVGQARSGNSELNDALDGDVFIHATPVSDDLRGTIEITFFRVSDTADFTSFKITQQYINNAVDFDVDLGTALNQIDNLRITGLNAGQVGPFPPGGGNQSFTTEDVNGTTVNAAVDKLIRANSSAVLEGTNNVIPEPATAGLLTLGAVMLLARRSRRA